MLTIKIFLKYSLMGGLKMLYDTAVIGGGPAGLSATLTLRQRNKSVILFEAKDFSPKLSKAHSVENYLGIPSISGKELMNSFVKHVVKHSPVIIYDKVVSVYKGEEVFTIATNQNSYQAKTIIFAVGDSKSKTLNGEKRLLGRGVSYCGTCDGMFFADKKVAVIATNKESDEETKFLTEVCGEVLYFPLFKGEYYKDAKITLSDEIPVEIIGDSVVSGIKTDKGSYEVDGVFIFRESEPLETLLDGLEIIDEKFIKIDGKMKTNIEGVFAAGDCVGHPWQISIATGQGVVAALSAVSYLFELKRS